MSIDEKWQLSRNNDIRVKIYGYRRENRARGNKNMFKLAVYRNNKLSQEQKQFAMNRIDAAACQANWIIQILKECGYLR